MMWDSGFLTDYTTKWRREADRRMREMKKMGIDALIRAMDVISYIYAHVYLCKTSVFMTIYISEKKRDTLMEKGTIFFLKDEILLPLYSLKIRRVVQILT